jgi:hypothetical protein
MSNKRKYISHIGSLLKSVTCAEIRELGHRWLMSRYNCLGSLLTVMIWLKLDQIENVQKRHKKKKWHNRTN